MDVTILVFYILFIIEIILTNILGDSIMSERERALERGNNRHAEADRVRQIQAESRHRESYTDSYRQRERAAESCRERDAEMYIEIQRERALRHRV